jgi:hypothetical protein
VSYLYLLILPAAALLALVLWYALIVGWAVVLGRMAQSVSAWDELEEDDASGRKESLGGRAAGKRLYAGRPSLRTHRRRAAANR